MVFSSMTFLAVYLPLVVIAYFIIPNRTWRNMVLLVASLGFYAWGEPKIILLMVAASAVAYVGSLLIHRFRERERLTKGILIGTMALILLNLFVFKYFNLMVDTAEAVLWVEWDIPRIVLPIGISFYTFQILSYVVDLYWGKVKVQKNFLHLLLYVSLFPQLIAGPIVRYETVEEEIVGRKENWEDFVAGIKRLIVGLGKKVILANNIGIIATEVFAGSFSVNGTSILWLAALSAVLQGYFDFSGYSDMAIGLGRMFGFHFLENFNYPYYSFSVTQRWKGWHISLSTWFRDYVYIPLGGNRVSTAKWIRNILVVWSLTGLWHGAEWSFLAWGLFNAALLLAEKFILGKILKKLPKVLRWFYMMAAMCASYVIFNMTDMFSILRVLKRMLIYRGTDWLTAIGTYGSLAESVWYLPLGLIFIFPVKNLMQKFPGRNTLGGAVVENMGYVLLLLVCIVYILSSSFNPFIYFRF